MAIRTVLAKFAQILVRVWQGQSYFTILRHFASSMSLASVKIFKPESGESGKFGYFNVYNDFAYPR